MTVRRAKIVATLGPASSTVDQIESLIRKGLNVARVNMSHGTKDAHKQLIKNIREASKRTGWEVAILFDLQGPKIRVDKLSKNIMLENGSEWVIGKTGVKEDYKEYKNCFIPTIYENLSTDVKKGERVLFDDGKMTGIVYDKDREVVKIRIEQGGELKSNKGINLPDSDISAPSFTEKDRTDLMFGLEQGIDYIALSFVRRKEDILEVKYLLHKLKMNIPIVAKIEKPEAIENLSEILVAADVIMVARGDMGVEVGNHLVPLIQKKIIRDCNRKGVPVITATQMLESMIESPTPTRAEASDIANAIWDGTDAVMLSAETASGKFPEESIGMMLDIIVEAEKLPKERPFLRDVDLSSVNASTMVAASMIAEKVNAKLILSVTQSGNSCRRIARFRPKTRVLGVTNSIETVRRLCLYWGVTPYLVKDHNRHDDELEFEVIEQTQKAFNLGTGDKIVVTRGDGQFFSRGSSNSVRVEIIKDVQTVLGSSEGIQEVNFAGGRISLDTHICASCQNCISICPHKIWVSSGDKADNTIIDKNRASECAFDMECVKACPTGAIEIFQT